MNPKEIEQHLQAQAERGRTRLHYRANNAGDIFDALLLHSAELTGDLRDTIWIRCDLRGSEFAADLSGATFYQCRLAKTTGLPAGVKIEQCEL